MPSVGLQNIEALYIQNTHTLKTIPSIYNFRVSKWVLQVRVES